MKSFKNYITEAGQSAERQENGFVDAINNGMRMDLNGTGVKVSQVCPGLVETEFSMVRFKGDEQTAKSVYEGYKPLQAEDIADTVHYCANLPEHVCINSVVMTCTSQANSFYLYK